MRLKLSTLGTALALGAMIVATPALAGGLLGGVLGGVVSVSAGEAGNSSLVNIGLGGDSVLSASTGGALTGTVGADVSVLGSSGVANVGANVGGGLVNANATVLGSGSIANVGANVGGLVDVRANVGGVGGIGACVGLGSSCGPNGNGNGPGTVPGKGSGPGNLPGSMLGSGGLAGLGAGCVSLDDQRAVNIVQQQYSGRAVASWSRARNANIIPVRVCPALRAKLASAVKRDPNLGMMQQAAASDALISTVLQRSAYNARNVLGVEQKGGTVSVYVF